jgi:hypothetical protein
LATQKLAKAHLPLAGNNAVGFIGVYGMLFLSPSAHTVEFRFKAPFKYFYTSLTALGIGLSLAGYITHSGTRNRR